uniref:Arylsulfatase family member K n=1 Tax=Rhinolophus ferrumequinum TaxID=59479 RepID=A0A671EI69_RHIFE
MLLLWVSVVAVSALAAPAPGTSGQRREAAQVWPDTPNVVLVVSDSFIPSD